MNTENTQIASPTLGQVLEPLIDILAWDESGKKPILIDEIENITDLPPVDPTTTALYQLYPDSVTPIPQRLCTLLLMTAGGEECLRVGQEGREPIPNPTRDPIRFSVLDQTVFHDGDLSHEYYLLAAMEADEPGSTAGLPGSSVEASTAAAVVAADSETYESEVA